MFIFLDDIVGTGNWKRSFLCHLFLMQSSTNAMSPVATTALKGSQSRDHVDMIKITTYSATSARPDRTLGSLIHIELGGTQPPFASSSSVSMGVMGLGTI